MNEYKIEIHETSSRIVMVNAKDEDAAIDDVQERYEDGDIVLDYNDYDDVKFEVV